MNRRLQFAGLLLLTVTTIFASDQAAKKNAVPNTVAPKPVVPKGGVPKVPVPKGAQRVINPDALATRLFRMTPAEREVYLGKMKPGQATKARNVLDWYDQLPKEQQELQVRRLDRFEKLSPEKKMEVHQATVDLQALPAPRRRQVAVALFRLQNMTDQQRDLTMRRPAFINRFSPEEFKIINSLADAWMGPQ